MTDTGFCLPQWSEVAYRRLVARLGALADPAYRAFHQKLIPEVADFIGVRTPALHALAKEIAKGDWRGYFAHACPDSYEEIMLYGLVIGRVRDFTAVTAELDRFVPLIDNWAVCDICCAGLKLTARHQAEMRDYLGKYLASTDEFPLRFGLVMLLDYYLDEAHIDEVLAVYSTVRHEGYYVRMAVAWGLSVCFVKFREKTLALLCDGVLDPDTYQKALQKILESQRVSAADKAMIRQLRKNAGRA